MSGSSAGKGAGTETPPGAEAGAGATSGATEQGTAEAVRAAATDVPFSEPWHARVFATAVVACQRLGLPWDAFRDRLKAAVADDPARPYYESFTVALERLTAGAGPAAAAATDARVPPVGPAGG